MSPDEDDPATQIGDYAFELVARLREEFGEDWELGELILVCEVHLPDGRTINQSLSSERRRHIARAVLDRAIEILDIGIEAEHADPLDADADD